MATYAEEDPSAFEARTQAWAKEAEVVHTALLKKAHIAPAS